MCIKTLKHLGLFAVMIVLCASCSSERPRQNPAPELDAAPAPSVQPEGLSPEAKRYVQAASRLGCMAFDAEVEDVPKGRAQLLLDLNLDEATYMKLAQENGPIPAVQTELAGLLADCNR